MFEQRIIRYKLFIKYLLSSSVNTLYHDIKDKDKIIIALAADYGNLGDVAITYAQHQFLQKRFPDKEIIEFPISKTFSEIKCLKKIVNSNDIITIVGGGNTGDMYDDIEYCRQFIIKQFPNNRIISFPQTIFFSDTVFGKKSLEKAIKRYMKHKNLVLAAREEESYNEYYKYFKSHTILFMPDIVLYLNKELPTYERKGIILCLRRDREKLIVEKQEEHIIQYLYKHFNITFYDTQINKNELSIEERDIELNKIWTAFKKSELVITDRLHGMIFCAITKTPCVAIDNSNHKISGLYNSWLKNIEYIDMIKDFDLAKLELSVNKLLNLDLCSIKEVNFKDNFIVAEQLLSDYKN